MTDIPASLPSHPDPRAAAPRRRRRWRRLFLLLVLGFVLMMVLGIFFGGPVLPDSMVLVLDVRGDVPERADQDFFRLLLEGQTNDVVTVRRALRRAADDPRVRGLIVRVGMPQMSLGRVQEFRALIDEFESSGKFAVSVLESADTLGYFLASAADRVFLDRSTSLHLVGLGMQALFLGDALRGFHVEPDFVRVGEYKGTYEQFTGSEPSEAFQSSMSETLDSLFSTLVEGIAEARGISQEEVRDAIDRGPFEHADVVETKLVDGALYRDEVRDYLRRIGGETAESVSVALYAEERAYHIPGRIALIHVDGMIVDHTDGSASPLGAGAGANLIVPAIREARESEDIVGLVVRVNSPGGMLSASEAIWRELSLTREKKPVVVSMGDVAASGGYYIATAADAIFAHAGTVTGSIGIFGGKIVMGGVFDKFDVNVYRDTRGKRAGIYDLSRKFNDDERVAMQKTLTTGYDQFLDRVVGGREMAVESVEAVAQGRVWTGAQALERGLVDGLGGIQEAFLKVCEKAGVSAIEEGPMVLFPREQSLVDLIVGEGSGGGSYLCSRPVLVESVLPDGVGADVVNALRAIGRMGFLDGRRAMTLLPFAVSVR